MSFPVKKLIQNRKSVRSFGSLPLSEGDRAAIEQYLRTALNPFGVPVEFRLLEAREHHLSSPVIVGASQYLAAKVFRQEHFEIGYGYSFEAACLYAQSLGIGTVMLAASLSREAFEKAMDVQANEVMPVASPVGYPAARRSLRESMMRKALKADDRIPFEQLWFDGGFDTGLKKERAGLFAEPLEMARWAPSAANRQPWRAVVIGDTVHFYEEKTMKDNALGDIQKVDVGIALAHFDLTMQEDGHEGRFIDEDPGLNHAENVHYITSFERVK